MPFHTDTGRLHAYADVPEAIEYGENFIVHREGPEATPYLPNVIVQRNPLRPARGLRHPARRRWTGTSGPSATSRCRGVEVKKTKNPLWEKGYQFYLPDAEDPPPGPLQWTDVDWHMLWDSNFGDPYRLDKRCPASASTSFT